MPRVAAWEEHLEFIDFRFHELFFNLGNYVFGIHRRSFTNKMKLEFYDLKWGVFFVFVFQWSVWRDLQGFLNGFSLTYHKLWGNYNKIIDHLI